jgi:hypothetical protein
MYNPLPNNLTIQTSGISGLGLFTKAKLPADTNLGMSHVELGKIMIRTPLGGFINHSDTPNCVKAKSLLTRQQWNSLNDLPQDKYDHNFPKWDLVTLRDIDTGEELTVYYTFYTI